jgi:protein SERAC1
VHSLTGDLETTWTATDASAPWPQTLLPLEIPDARILTFGYDIYVADWRAVVSKDRVTDHAWSLLTVVANYREKDDTVGVAITRTSNCADICRMSGQ